MIMTCDKPKSNGWHVAMWDKVNDNCLPFVSLIKSLKTINRAINLL